MSGEHRFDADGSDRGREARSDVRGPDYGRESRADAGQGEPERVVVRNRRRIDPLTGEVRIPDDAQASAGTGPAPASADPGPELAVKLTEVTAQLAERTTDLQRVSAEYANYRRRVDRDRETVAVAARAQLAGELLTVLDDVARAEAHGDLTGAFKAVADKLVATLDKLGLAAFGTEGEPFDPSVHEAVQHITSPEVSGPTVGMVLRSGYRLGERVLRPAMVVVTDRDPSAEAPELPDQEVDEPSS